MPKSRVPYRPHSKQTVFHNAAGIRNRGLFCSRRWGKDEATVHEVNRLFQHWRGLRKPPHIIPRIHAWFVSPTRDLSADWRRRFQRVYFGHMREVKSENKFELLDERGRPLDMLLEFRSVGDHPERLVSVGLDLAILTECHLIPDAAINELRPTLISPDRVGWMLATGIPSPVPWMESWKDAADNGNPDYWYMTGASAENPHIDPAVLAAEIEATPSHVAGPLYLGEWPSASGSVFRRIGEACTIECGSELPIFHGYTGGPVFDGLDLARQTDFMVYAALEQLPDGTLKQVALDRFNRNDWDVQVRRIAGHVNRFPTRAGFFDETGIGDVVGPLLINAGARFRGLNFGGSNVKSQLVTGLSNALDAGRLRLFNHSLIRDELRRYTFRMTPDGNYKYGAPSGFHDDVVTALGLAVWAAQHSPIMSPDQYASLVRRIS